MAHYIVPSDHQNTRLDTFLTEMLAGEYSRTVLQKSIKEGNVKVGNKISKKVSTSLNEYEHVYISLPKPLPPQNIEAENIPLEIIYEDENMLVINKPSDMCTHPDHSHKKGTLVHALLGYLGTSKLSSLGGGERPGIVHRLDKDTSGAIMVAKNDKTHRFLSEQIANRNITKKYTTCVFGRLKTEKGTIDSPIARHQHNRQKMTVIENHLSRPALTHFTTQSLYDDPAVSIVDIHIITGRTHQIRVHMESIGFPVVNDPLYGNPVLNEEFSKNF